MKECPTCKIILPIDEGSNVIHCSECGYIIKKKFNNIPNKLLAIDCNHFDDSSPYAFYCQHHEKHFNSIFNCGSCEDYSNGK